MYMNAAELKVEHAYRYNERLALLGVYGVPSAEQHNMAVLEADEVVRQLRKENGMVARLKEFRESL